MTFDEALESAYRVYVAAWFDEHPPEAQPIAA